MKKTIASLILIALCSLCFGQEIKFTVTASDPVTGKRVKYTSVTVMINQDVMQFIGTISLTEINDSPASANGTTELAKRAVQGYTENFSTQGRMINSVSKLYVASLTDVNGAPIANNVTLDAYLRSKAVNSYPGTAGSDPLVKLLEGLCKEMIAVRKANGEFVD